MILTMNCVRFFFNNIICLFTLKGWKIRTFVLSSSLGRKVAPFKGQGTPQALAIGLIVVFTNDPP